MRTALSEESEESEESDKDPFSYDDPSDEDLRSNKIQIGGGKELELKAKGKGRKFKAKFDWARRKRDLFETYEDHHSKRQYKHFIKEIKKKGQHLGSGDPDPLYTRLYAEYKTDLNSRYSDNDKIWDEIPTMTDYYKKDAKGKLMVKKIMDLYNIKTQKQLLGFIEYNKERAETDSDMSDITDSEEEERNKRNIAQIEKASGMKYADIVKEIEETAKKEGTTADEVFKKMIRGEYAEASSEESSKESSEESSDSSTPLASSSDSSERWPGIRPPPAIRGDEKKEALKRKEVLKLTPKEKWVSAVEEVSGFREERRAYQNARFAPTTLTEKEIEKERIAQMSRDAQKQRKKDKEERRKKHTKKIEEDPVSLGIGGLGFSSSSDSSVYASSPKTMKDYIVGEKIRKEEKELRQREARERGDEPPLWDIKGRILTPKERKWFEEKGDIHSTSYRGGRVFLRQNSPEGDVEGAPTRNLRRTEDELRRDLLAGKIYTGATSNRGYGEFQIEMGAEEGRVWARSGLSIDEEKQRLVREDVGNMKKPAGFLGKWEIRDEDIEEAVDKHKFYYSGKTEVKDPKYVWKKEGHKGYEWKDDDDDPPPRYVAKNAEKGSGSKEGRQRLLLREEKRGEQWEREEADIIMREVMKLENPYIRPYKLLMTTEGGIGWTFSEDPTLPTRKKKKEWKASSEEGGYARMRFEREVDRWEKLESDPNVEWDFGDTTESGRHYRSDKTKGGHWSIYSKKTEEEAEEQRLLREEVAKMVESSDDSDKLDDGEGWGSKVLMKEEIESDEGGSSSSSF